MLLPHSTDWFIKEFHKFQETAEGKNIAASFQNLTKYVQNQTGLVEMEFVRTAQVINGMEFSVRIILSKLLNYT